MLSSVTPQSYIFDKNGNIQELESLSCQAVISPHKYVVTSDDLTCTTQIAPQFHEISEDEYNKLKEVQMAESPKSFNLSQGNQYFVNSPSGVDPGVVAVSNALFTSNSAFQTIPIANSPNIFRRRKRGEPNSEWSNAFVTRIDPCECAEPEEEYRPYEMTKFYDETGVKTVFNFDNEAAHEQM